MLMRTYLAAAERAHPALTRMDQVAGDGDFGDNLRDALRLAVGRVPGDATLPAEFDIVATCFLDEVGGTSGPLIGLLLRDIAARLAGSDDLDEALASGLAAGVDTIQRVGEARVGDRTMLDCLVPALDAIAAAARPVDWVAIAASALAAARATADLTARSGRASYVGDRALGTPDAGAMGIALLFWALAADRHPDRRDELPDPGEL
ncbi:DAK2 domain-containing protein [Acrocarpospora macrocephala]|uniref:Dihydroxyacetone kinase n=1 Tax=Acrocarpospora macrocephala TaxID=150177 RepID=A0A5M3WZQ3_9ACTN|nr:DAK2 domain-containing protein [Acrocarpospora macrocephala]GES13906.1 dihydroxyacetone kinase [Acrocarpospora macrocephala]